MSKIFLIFDIIYLALLSADIIITYSFMDESAFISQRGIEKRNSERYVYLKGFIVFIVNIYKLMVLSSSMVIDPLVALLGERVFYWAARLVPTLALFAYLCAPSSLVDG